MNDIAKQPDRTETGDYVEAVAAFKSFKNFTFTLAFLGLLALQLVFWMNYFGYVDKSECPRATQRSAAPAACPLSDAGCAGGLGGSEVLFCSAVVMTDAPASAEPVDAAGDPAVADVAVLQETVAEGVEAESAESAEESDVTDRIAEQAREAVGAAREAVEEAKAEIVEALPEASGGCVVEAREPRWSLGRFDEYIPKCACVAWAVRILNFIVILLVMLYSLALLISIKISIAGRLGGLGHISRAFIRSLFALVLLIPWQLLFPNTLLGAIYTPTELFCSPIPAIDTENLLPAVLYFLRFSGMWLLVILFLVGAQSRSGAWSKATLRRLGILR